MKIGKLFQFPQQVTDTITIHKVQGINEKMESDSIHV